jgi:hypothetical protein
MQIFHLKARHLIAASFYSDRERLIVIQAQWATMWPKVNPNYLLILPLKLVPQRVKL